ncbi:hypothetical protein [Enterobacter ludwigii]|uniref:hypothetical protein n=1 Tax=Enterobacter ludwigii TaxID=299767 RepID=UPI003D167EFB
MDENKKDNVEKQDESNISRALSIRMEEFGDYFLSKENKHGEMVCPLCRGTVWGIPPRFDAIEHPALVTYPLPNSSGRGIWAYPLICSGCGFIATFSAFDVSKKIRG